VLLGLMVLFGVIGLGCEGECGYLFLDIVMVVVVLWIVCIFMVFSVCV